MVPVWMASAVPPVPRVVVVGTACVLQSAMCVGGRERERGEPYGCGFVSELERRAGFGT